MIRDVDCLRLPAGIGEAGEIGSIPFGASQSVKPLNRMQVFARFPEQYPALAYGVRFPE